MPATPFHDTVRAAVAQSLTDAFLANGIDVNVVEQDEFDPTILDRPVVVCTFDAGPDSVVGTNNASDYRRYPIGLVYCTVTPDADAREPSGGRLTLVREQWLILFNQQRIASLTASGVYVCNYDPNGPINDERRMEQLNTQATISVFARRPRGA